VAGHARAVAGPRPRTRPAQRTTATGEYAPIHRALLTGLLSSIGKKSETNPYEYQGARGNTFSIFPGSGLFRPRAAPGSGSGGATTPKWIMAAEIVKTTKTYARTVAVIEPRWIEDLGRHLVKRTYQEPHWDAQSAQAMAYETVSLFGLEIVKRRRVPYGHVEPVQSRAIFIQHALVNGEYLTQAPFFEHNHSPPEIDPAAGKQGKSERSPCGYHAAIQVYTTRVCPRA